MREDVHERCKPGFLRPQSHQLARHAKAPGWRPERNSRVGLWCCPFLSSISFGKAKEIDSGFGVKPQKFKQPLKE